MCGRYALATPSSALAEMLSAEDLMTGWRARYNLAPMQDAPVLRMPGGTRRVLERRRWGLVPGWAKDESIASRLLNARSETAATTAAFRGAMRARRCVVPADGFYEWQAIPGGKRPHYIHRADGRPLLFAGLFEDWPAGPQGDPAGAGPADQRVRTFTILTTGANDFMRALHDRMPVILEPEDLPAFLDPDRDGAAVTPMLRAAPDGVLEAHPVSSRVGNVRNDTADLVLRATEREGLF
ncbi:MAG: SOS response-associated peptidase [Phycisphaerales bacterium]